MVKRTPKTSTIGISTNKETSNLAGTYYVGTYEKRPGSSTDYRVASATYPQGNIQGDVPVGTMTSQAFTISGTSINFLIGGGCDMFTIYVSLLVDGMEVGRVTGQCTEYMERKSFDVTVYYGRSAQLRIVDASSSSWGHINVDDFKFDWDNKGSVVNGTSAATDRTVFGGQVETPQCGAAYAFRRHITGSDDFCSGVDRFSCTWTEETKLMASDKRSYAYFGTSISVNDEAGIIVIGAPHAHLTGFYKELMRSYPYIESTTGGFDATGPSLPMSQFRYDLYTNMDSYAPFATGTKAVTSISILEGVDQDDRISKEAGAVYVFRKTHAVEALGSVAVAPYWSFTEQSKVQPPDAMVKDHFGTSVSIDDRALVVGAPGQDGYQPDAGAMYYYNSGFGAVYFQDVS